MDKLYKLETHWVAVLYIMLASWNMPASYHARHSTMNLCSWAHALFPEKPKLIPWSFPLRSGYSDTAILYSKDKWLNHLPWFLSVASTSAWTLHKHELDQNDAKYMMEVSTRLLQSYTQCSCCPSEETSENKPTGVFKFVLQLYRSPGKEKGPLLATMIILLAQKLRLCTETPLEACCCFVEHKDKFLKFSRIGTWHLTYCSVGSLLTVSEVEC